MISYIRKSRWAKVVSLTLAFSFVSEVIFPTVALALTGGPSQPEVESFAPIEATDMVDLFSGDFKYNIPLLDVDGYPINLNYNSNITMDQEASWVGLGWNLNPGVINRSMRGLPDEFCGDLVTKEFNLKEDNTYGLRVYLRPEFFSKNLSPLSLGYTMTYSTKNGFNVETNLGISTTLAKVGASRLNVGLNFSSSTNNGFNFNPSVAFNAQVAGKEKDNVQSTGNLGLKIGFPINSVGGLKAMQLGISATETSKFVKCRNEAGNPVYRFDEKSFSGGSLDGSSTVSFVPNTYTPQIQIPVENLSCDINLNIGCDLKISDAFGAIGGFYLGQKVRNNTIIKPAYGYYNNVDGILAGDALLDFNREKDVVYHPEIKNLPVTNRTYDIYSVQGQGAGGTFRSYNNDNNYVCDDYNQNTSTASTAGFELAFTDIVKGGIDLSFNNTYTNSKVWNSLNAYINYYKRSKSSNLLYEKSHFKMVGESNIESDESFLTGTGFNTATRLELMQAGGLDVALLNKYTTKYKGSFSDPASKKRSTRQKRNQYIGVLSAGEASIFGIDKIISSYFKNNFNYGVHQIVKSNIDRSQIAGGSTANSIKKHPSELSILQTDGTRYVYGIPAYVTKQVEACFSVDKLSSSNSKCQVAYTADDPTVKNKKGYDNYLSKTTLPPYAHSYLLTAQLSSDYIDLNGDGPTDDDMGNYTKFNYTSMYATTGQYYKWRTPYETNEASYNEGLRSVDGDEKGNYIYGEKDIWYLHSIETKNYIVEFELDDRADGYGVQGENGGRNSQNLTQQLKKITLYAKKDRVKNGTSATPIKTVHFEYDYTLCQGVPNNINTGANNKGKLTLRKVYFTYGNSYKGKLNAYTFNYNESVIVNGAKIYNPDYDVKGCDRWGFYKPSSTNQLTTGSSVYSYEYPYVDQREVSGSALLPYGKYNTDIYTATWSLSEITTPSGATIKVKYESDDYAYVQDKRAMQMMKIEGFDISTGSGPGNNILYENQALTTDYYNKIFISVPDPVSTKEDISRKYLNGVDQLYFKCLTNIESGKQEYISGYAKITDYGPVSGDNTKIWILTDDFTRAGENPVAVACWKFCMDNARHFIDNTNPPGQGADPFQIVKTMAGMGILDGLIKTINGPWATARSNEIGKTVDLNYCWVRLQNPNGHKLGGGSRVKEINIVDNWAQPAVKTYGQTYDYTLKEVFAESTGPVPISSGVASYEPMTGSDEIPHRTAVFYKTSGGFLQPDTYGSLEMPMGESFFPAPSVGYRQVTVKSLSNTQVTNHGTGKVVHEFYTAKEFPVKCNDITDLQAIPLKSGWFENLFTPYKYNKMYVSQGYLIEINDMHGKPKSKKVYAEGDDPDPISGEEYLYKLSGKNLDNTVETIGRDGVKRNSMVNVDYDITNDFRESVTDATQSGAQINLTFFTAGIVPVLLPPVWGSLSFDNVTFRSSVTTKVVNYYGVLQDVIKFDQSSRVKTSNELYDSESGEVLLTKTQNSFKDDLYTFKYPAHWAYPGMRPAYENTGLELLFRTTDNTNWAPLSISNGTLNLSTKLSSVSPSPSARDLFTSGDELSVECLYSGTTFTQTIKAWVLDLNSTHITLVDFNGSKIPDNTLIYKIKVIRSGRKNQHTQPIASLVSRKSPVSLLNGNLQSAEILEAEAIEYDNVRKVYCGTQVFECKNYSTQEFLDIIKVINYLISKNKLFNATFNSGNATINFPVNLNLPEYANYFPLYLKNKLPSQFHVAGAGIYLCCFKDLVSNSIEFQLYPQNISGTAGNSSIRYLWFGFRLSSGGNVLNIGKILSFNNFNPAIITTNKCTYSNEFTADITYVTKSNIVETENIFGSFVTVDDNIHAYEPISVPSYTSCGIGVENIINPFTYGILGNWTPRKSYKYLTKRLRTDNGTDITSNIRQDGNYSEFNPFWVLGTGDRDWKQTTDQSKWQWTNMIWQKDRNGTEIENINALNIHSSALFGSAGNLPLAVAANARHKEILFDGFEEVKENNQDISYGTYTPDCQKHFQYNPPLYYVTGAADVSVTDTRAHSGKYSMKLMNGKSTEIYSDFDAQNNNYYLTIGKQDCNSRWSEDVLATKNDALVSELPMNPDECLVKFSPDPTVNYIISYWLSTENNTILTSQSTLPIELTFVGNNNSGVVPMNANSVSVSRPIEGWQRVEVSFSIPVNFQNSHMSLKINNTGTEACYLDDIRILPKNSSMKSYVYNEVTKRLMAELDDNNYASFYEYDEDGSLVRIKKETEKGVFTIKEVRKSLKKQ